MYKRNLYLKKISPLINTPVIKVITGMRRAGKSCLMKLIMDELSGRSADARQIVYINKESLEYDFIKDYKSLHSFVKKRFQSLRGQKYLLIDEVQEIHSWEKAVASFFSQGDTDIYLTGSNANMLSSEIATLLSGRYIEIPVYTLGFDEFLIFRQSDRRNLHQDFSDYLKFGGFPAFHHFPMNETVIYPYIASIYDTILLKDVIRRNNIRNVRLIEDITKYLFENTGNIFSSKKVSDFLKSQKINVGIETVQNYISYLNDAYAVHKASRYDLKGKRVLELHEKYYMGDIGLRHALFGYRERDIAGMLENVVFLELRRRGYDVHIGKIGDAEIDFIAEKEQKRIYVQVAYLLESEKTVNREVSPLLQIPDNYPKYVISTDPFFGNDIQGIKRLHIIDFLLGNVEDDFIS